MSKLRHIAIESALVAAVLATGITAAGVAHATPLAMSVQAADARANVKIESKVQVERSEKDAAGQDTVKLHDPNTVKVIPGDRLVFTNSYRNTGAVPVTGFVVNNPVHSAVSFSAVSEDWAVVSVDGGKMFGKLADLVVTVPADEGAETASGTTTRSAQPADVTHIRWIFDKPIAANASGKLQFRGVVK